MAVTDDDFGDDDLFELPDIESHNDEPIDDDLLRAEPVETSVKDEDDLSRLDPDEPGEIHEEGEEKVLEINGKIIAIIAGIAIVVIVALVLFFFVLGTPAPPDVKLKSEQNGEIVYLYHEGGDSLEQQYLHIYIGPEEVPVWQYSLLSADWPWSIGNILKVDCAGYPLPALFRVTYLPGKEEYTLLTTTLSAPPTPEPTPQADFSATPTTGPAALTVQFSDTSAYSPNSWFWSFGDGETSTEKNPSHIYSNPGTYTVNLTVSNDAGKDTGMKKDYITATIPVIGPPITQTSQESFSPDQMAALSGTKVEFQGFPTSGTTPLHVQFGDMSSGCYLDRVWDFGDNITSNEPYPNHTYPFAGSYNVSLTVTCSKDNIPSTLIKPDYISAIGPDREDIIVSGKRTAALQPGGKIFFTVAGPHATIKIAGRDYQFLPGDLVEMVIGNDGTGTLAVVPGVITDCSFDDITLYKNGEFLVHGVLKSIFIGTYENLETSRITVVVPAQSEPIKGFIPDKEDISGHFWEELVLSDIGIDNTGNLQLITNYPQWFSLRGAVVQYQYNRIPQYA